MLGLFCGPYSGPKFELLVHNLCCRKDPGLNPDSDKFICAKSFLPRAKGSRVRLKFRSAASLYFRSERALLSGCLKIAQQAVLNLLLISFSCYSSVRELEKRLLRYSKVASGIVARNGVARCQRSPC